MELKAGDRVRLNREGMFRACVDEPLTGTVLFIDNGTPPVAVLFDKGADWFHDLGGKVAERKGFYLQHDELELVRIRNTKLARKIYPNAKECGEWLEI